MMPSYIYKNKLKQTLQM